MAKVELMDGIKSISGRVGDIVFVTRKSTGQVYAYMRPRRK